MPDKMIVTKTKLDALATSVSQKTGVAAPLTIAGMKTAIDNLDLTINLQDKEVTPSTSQQIITSDQSYIITLTSCVEKTYTLDDNKATWNLTFEENPIIGKTYHITLYATRTYRGRTYSFDTDVVWTGFPFTIVPTIVKGDATANENFTLNSTKIEHSYNMMEDSGFILTFSFTEVILYDGLSSVTVNPIPSQYIIPTSSMTITQNGTGIDIAQYATVDVAVPTGSTPTLQTKTVTPTTSQQSVTPDTGYDGLSSVTVEAIQTQTKSVNPLEIPLTIRPDTGKYLSSVSVGAIRSDYVGSGVPQHTSADLTVSGATVTAPYGYYSGATSASVASGTMGTPTATKGTVSNHSVSVTPSVTNTAGYITGGTVNGTAVTVSASELVSGSETKTTNGTYDVTNLAEVVVNVPATTPTLQSKTATPSESQQTVTADTGYDGLSQVTVGAISNTYVGTGITRPTVTAQDEIDMLSGQGGYVLIPAGYYANDVMLNVGTSSVEKPTISIDTSTGLITSTVNYNQGWVTASNAYPETKTLQLTTQVAKTVTPTESEQTAVAAGVYTTGIVKVGAISSTYVGSGITQRSSTDLTASGATVTVPAGYYASQTSKSVTTMTLPTSASSTSSGTSKATINRSTSAQYINIPAGYNTTASYYQIAATPNGAVTAPANIIGADATLNVTADKTGGGYTLSLTKSVSITPNVTTAGYISAGTAGNSAISLSAAVTGKAAATITPGTSNQTIAAGTYLVGTQTIAGDADLVGSNIISTANIFGVQGTVQIQHVYTGSSAPSSSTGSNGDIYIQGS